MYVIVLPRLQLLREREASRESFFSIQSRVPKFAAETEFTYVARLTHRALLAVPARVLPVLRLGALALAAHALALPRAQLVDVLAVRRDASLVGRAALARSVTLWKRESQIKY